jgi:hypothetical protein
MRLRLMRWVAAALLGGRLAAAEPPAPAELRALDEQGRALAPAQLRVSLARSLPPELGGPEPEEASLRFLVVGPLESLKEPVVAATLDARGNPLDALANIPTQPVKCPGDVTPGQVCRQTEPLRLVSDDVERRHPAISQRAIRAELGGVLRVGLGQQMRLELPVVAPRELGTAARYRARLRVLVLRRKRGGPPALGGSDAEAKRLMRLELASAATIWGQCGIDLGLGTNSSIDVVDPPASAIVEIGCGIGQPASGGQLRLGLGTRSVVLETHAGDSPASVALRLADAVKEGVTAPRVFENERATADALSTAELLLEGRAAGRALSASSTDPTLSVCVGRVDLNDGLTHFADGDAFSGTLEERALLRGLDDGDARTVEVVVVPSFERGERIGESFIVSPGSSLPNAVIIDRTAIAAGARSFALAHELGHVLLAMPGHPDDFGVDQSWSLMDSDVADATIFGPRRLSLQDCRRALTQTGPASLVPILEPLPL